MNLQNLHRNENLLRYLAIGSAVALILIVLFTPINMWEGERTIWGLDDRFNMWALLTDLSRGGGMTVIGYRLAYLVILSLLITVAIGVFRRSYIGVIGGVIGALNQLLYSALAATSISIISFMILRNSITRNFWGEIIIGYDGVWSFTIIALFAIMVVSCFLLKKWAENALKKPEKSSVQMQSRICNLCNHKNAPNINFCGKCGASLLTPPPAKEAATPPISPQIKCSCGYSSPIMGAVFCGKCGASLLASPPAKEAHRPQHPQK